MHNHAKPWIYLALIYFFIAVTLGVYMGAKQDFALRSVHTHINLLGWASLTLTGLIYQFFPHAGHSRLAHMHFWLYNTGVPIMLIGLAMLARGLIAVEPAVAVGSIMVLLAVGMFMVNVLRHRA